MNPKISSLVPDRILEDRTDFRFLHELERLWSSTIFLCSCLPLEVQQLLDDIVGVPSTSTVHLWLDDDWLRVEVVLMDISDGLLGVGRRRWDVSCRFFRVRDISFTGSEDDSGWDLELFNYGHIFDALSGDDLGFWRIFRDHSLDFRNYHVDIDSIVLVLFRDNFINLGLKLVDWVLFGSQARDRQVDVLNFLRRLCGLALVDVDFVSRLLGFWSGRVGYVSLSSHSLVFGDVRLCLNLGFFFGCNDPGTTLCLLMLELDLHLGLFVLLLGFLFFMVLLSLDFGDLGLGLRHLLLGFGSGFYLFGFDLSLSSSCLVHNPFDVLDLGRRCRRRLLCHYIVGDGDGRRWNGLLNDSRNR